MQPSRQLLSTNNKLDFGEITPSFYRSGPVSKRSCTDLFCFLLFISFSLGMIIVYCYAFQYGNVKLLFRGFDSSGNMCGTDEYKEYPYIYFAKLDKDYLYQTVCVSECPNSKNLGLSTTLQCVPNTVITECRNAQLYDTAPMLRTVCLPTDKENLNIIESALNLQKITYLLMNLIPCWKMIAGAMLFAYLLGIIFVFLVAILRYVLLILAIVVIEIGLLFIATFILCIYIIPKEVREIFRDFQLSDTLDDFFDDFAKDLRLIIAICFYIASLVFLLSMIIYNKQIKLLIEVLKPTRSFLMARKAYTLISFVFFLVYVIYVFFWICFSIYLITWVDTRSDIGTNKIFPFYQYRMTNEAIIFLILHFVALIWNLAFIICTYNFILGSSCTYWYFTHGIDDENKSPYHLKDTLKLLFKYHFGSISLGSILLIIFRLFNSIFGSCYNKIVEESEYKNNTCQKYTLKCCLCFFILYDKIFRYINRDAYLIMSLKGKNFIESSKDSYYLIKRNKDKYDKISNLGHLILWLGKLFICMVTTITSLIGAIIFEQFAKFTVNIFLPLMIILIFSFFVGNVIMNVLGCSIDSLIFIYLLDEEIEKTYYNKLEAPNAPPSLKEFMREVTEIN